MEDKKKALDEARVLVTGGTGSLGKVLVRRILGGEWGEPEFVRIFSRDEGKQHAMRVELGRMGENEAGLAYRAISGMTSKVRYVVGDVRDQSALKRAVHGCTLVFNAAALKQVPSCEYFPWEAVRTNVEGPHNLVEAILDLPPHRRPEKVVGISTDKACKPVNVMGLTKAIQERVFQEANLHGDTEYVCCRYGNVLASRGSVIPLFHHQIASGGPVTVTHGDMTRFFLTLDKAVDTVMAAVTRGAPGEVWIPRVPAARILDLAEQMVDAIRPSTEVRLTEVRPGEKLHEVLVSREEAPRTRDADGYYVIRSMLPEVAGADERDEGIPGRYCSADDLMNAQQVRELLAEHRLLDPPRGEGELLR